MAQQSREKGVKRNVVDMHISGHLPEFFSQFDEKAYVRELVKIQAQSAVVYVHSHVGYALFPSQVAPRHPNLNGRDIFGLLVEECQQQGIFTVGYMSLIFDALAAQTHPDWSIRRYDGETYYAEGNNRRYGVCCPNAPGYARHAEALAVEICTNYPVDGIRFDMTFWPGICYCPHCRARYAREVGGDIPTVMNWHNPAWAKFQRARERWLAEFAQRITSAAKAARPGVSVEHQSSTFSANYGYGVSADLRDANDMLQGDFYGGYVQGSVACKLFSNLSPTLPYGFETCANERISDHTTLRTRETLEAKTFMAIANNGAFVFIDAIDPVGTLNPHTYDVMRDIYEKVTPYERFMGGVPVADVALYLSTESKCNFADNGRPVAEAALSVESEHVNALMGAAKALMKHHIPFTVITRKNLQALGQYRVVALPQALMLSPEECGALREYVRAGGRLYASRYTSLTDTEGNRQADFMLADVFGARHEGETEENLTYMAPGPAGAGIFPPQASEKYPVMLYSPQVLAAPTTAQTLASLVLPYTNPASEVPFASIHSNPPGRAGGAPSLLYNQYGEGAALYCAADLETNPYHGGIFAAMMRRLLDGPPTFEGAAPPQVEVTLFRHESSLRLCFLTFQEEMPNLPIPAFEARVACGGGAAKAVRLLPGGGEIPFRIEGGSAVFRVEGFDTFCMIEVAL